MKFFVLTHKYNDTRSWWEPYFGDGLVDAKDIDAMTSRLSYDGLYKIYAVSDAVEVTVETRKVRDRHVRVLPLEKDGHV